jgi:hypothetical protein
MNFRFYQRIDINKNTSRFMALVFLVALLLPQAALALTVSPVRLELSGNPGDNTVSTIKVINSTFASKTYFTNVETFEAMDETGNPTFKVVKTDLANWINVPDAITLGPNESKDIPFSVSIPKDAEPGGYFAAILLTENPPQQNGGVQVALSSQVGTLVLFRVSGNIQEGVDILEFDAKNHQHWFTSLPVTFYFRFQNSGQSWVKPLGDIIVKDFFGKTAAIVPANPVEGNVLPQSIRRFENSWTGKDGLAVQPGQFWSAVLFQFRNFAFGPYTVRLNVAYNSQNGMQGSTATATVWVFPWQLSLVSLIAAVIAFYILRFVIRKYNRTIISRSQRRKSR